MNTSYRRLIGWTAVATIAVLALSVGIGAAEDNQLEPVECVSNATANTTVCTFAPPTTTGQAPTTTTEPASTTTTEPAPTTTEPASTTTTEPVVVVSDPPAPTTEPVTTEPTPWTPPDPAYFDCDTAINVLQIVPTHCEPVWPTYDYCTSTNTTRWSITPCVYVADIGEPQVIDTTTTVATGRTLPATGSNSTLAVIAVLMLGLGGLCLIVRAIGRDMDNDRVTP